MCAPLCANGAPYMRNYEGRTGIEWIRDGLREAYRQNGNNLNKNWTAQELSRDRLSHLTFVNSEDFSLVYVSDKPTVVRIECQHVYPLREGPLALE